MVTLRATLIAALLLVPVVGHVETTVYAGLQYDTDRSAAQCWLSDRDGNLRSVGQFGVRHTLMQSGRWSVVAKAEHVSCLEASDLNSTNSVGVQVEYTFD